MSTILPPSQIAIDIKKGFNRINELLDHPYTILHREPFRRLMVAQIFATLSITRLLHDFGHVQENFIRASEVVNGFVVTIFTQPWPGRDRKRDGKLRAALLYYVRALFASEAENEEARLLSNGTRRWTKEGKAKFLFRHPTRSLKEVRSGSSLAGASQQWAETKHRRALFNRGGGDAAAAAVDENGLAEELKEFNLQADDIEDDAEQDNDVDEEKKVLCQICDEYFSGIDSLQKHQEDKH